MTFVLSIDLMDFIDSFTAKINVKPFGSKLDFADLRRSAGDEDEAVQEPVGDFCTLPVIR
jgi:hypothetical protein